MVPVLIGISLVIFVLVRVVPGDPAQVALGLYATPDTIAELRAHWGLDQPIIVQYGIFLLQMLRGDLGYSYFYSQPAISLVFERLTPELFLVAYAIVLTIALSVPLAIWSALRRDWLSNGLVRVLIVFGSSMPAYWVGMLLLLLLAIWLPIFPIGGYGPTLGEQLSSLFLPALTLAFALTPLLVRSLRASLIEAMEADHVDMARSKGVVETVVFFRHAFRLALIPSVTLLGLHIGLLIGSTLIVEFVFAIPGLGQLMLTAITTRDYPTVVAVTLVFALFVMVVNLATDIVVAFLDPRARAALVTAQ
jgi:peptide/nickel transport system permease protein